jgi:hypothetical protein
MNCRGPAGERSAEGASPCRTGIAVFTWHGVPALRAVLHGIHETVDEPHELHVCASDCPEELGMFLMRQYLRGRINGFHLDTTARPAHHCGLDQAYHLMAGDYLVRIDDTLELQPDWLARAVAVLDAEPSIGCLSLVPPVDYQRGRGRPRTVHIEPVEVEQLDMRCFVTRRELVASHEGRLMGDGAGSSCLFQEFLVRSGKKLAYLPGLVKDLNLDDIPQTPDCVHEGELPVHEPSSGAMQRLPQAYQLGDDILLTCLACGAPELEVLEARIKFCDLHWVAIGHMYELRCPRCKELFYREDLRFRCTE